MAAGKRQGIARDRAWSGAVPKGIAHVSFLGGSLFCPARTPYDRQMLIEYIVDRVRAKERVQVLMGELRWMVHLRQGGGDAQCSACGGGLSGGCYSTDEGGQGYCLGCAFGDCTAEAEPKPELERNAS